MTICSIVYILDVHLSLIYRNVFFWVHDLVIQFHDRHLDFPKAGSINYLCAERCGKGHYSCLGGRFEYLSKGLHVPPHFGYLYAVLGVAGIAGTMVACTSCGRTAGTLFRRRALESVLSLRGSLSRLGGLFLFLEPSRAVGVS